MMIKSSCMLLSLSALGCSHSTNICRFRSGSALFKHSKYFFGLKSTIVEMNFSSQHSDKLKRDLPGCSRSQALAYLPSWNHSNSPNHKTVVCIEGNIGCGKTTLLNYFEAFQNCEVLAEPVEKWRNVEGYNALGLMYTDPERWGMALQTYIQLTMLQNHNQPQVKDVRLMERSIYSAKYCFTDNLFESGKMPGIEHVILTKWYDWILSTQNIQVDLFVYLRTDPELLHQRIMKRCRKEEEGIPVDLLKALHEKYEDWLIHKKDPCPAEVLVIDANQSLEEMQECYETYKSKILVSQTVV